LELPAGNRLRVVVLPKEGRDPLTLGDFEAFGIPTGSRQEFGQQGESRFKVLPQGRQVDPAARQADMDFDLNGLLVQETVDLVGGVQARAAGPQELARQGRYTGSGLIDGPGVEVADQPDQGQVVVLQDEDPQTIFQAELLGLGGSEGRELGKTEVPPGSRRYLLGPGGRNAGQ
jgi:hypothetical protein